LVRDVNIGLSLIRVYLRSSAANIGFRFSRGARGKAYLAADERR
jgi:hypothetical protein